MNSAFYWGVFVDGIRLLVVIIVYILCLLFIIGLYSYYYYYFVYIMYDGILFKNLYIYCKIIRFFNWIASGIIFMV